MGSEPTPVAHAVRLGRQPILDRERKLVAFELLFRSSSDNHCVVTDARSATADVIINAFFELGVRQVLGPHEGFLNIDAEVLMSESLDLLPTQQIVLEILETVQIDEPVLVRARELSRRGFRLAADDVTTYDAVAPLLGLVDIVKIDVLATPADALEGLVARLRAGGRKLQLLAEKVETHEQARVCSDLGFDLFQGYFFARPEILTGQRLDVSKTALLRLVALVQSDAENDAIESEFRHHPQLAYSLMRLVNSVGLGLAERVGTLRHGLIVLGRRQLRRWVLLLAYGTRSGKGVPEPGVNPLMQLAATRARLMERLAELEAPSDREYRDRSFMTGVLSLFEALLAAPIAVIVESLNPIDEVRVALLEHKGRIGRLLDLVERLESGDRRGVSAILTQIGSIGEHDLLLAELDAVRWANEFGAGA